MMPLSVVFQESPLAPQVWPDMHLAVVVHPSDCAPLPGNDGVALQYADQHVGLHGVKAKKIRLRTIERDAGSLPTHHFLPAYSSKQG